MSLESVLEMFPADPTFWVAVSFVIFVLLAVVKGRGVVIGMLDKNIAAVKKQLLEAEQVKKDAESFYQAAEKKLAEATQLANEILSNNKEFTQKLLTDADEKLQKQLAQKEKQLENRLAQDKAKLKHQLVQEVASAALSAARGEIEKEASRKDRGQKLVQDAIQKLSNLQ